jgi:hypothetical protein
MDLPWGTAGRPVPASTADSAVDGAAARAADGAADGAEAYVMASKFELTSGWRTPAFLALAIRAWRQARRSPGALGVTLRAQPLRLSYWTLSAWTGKDALDAFARAEPHRTIMRRVRPWAKTATFRFWTADAAQLTPDRLWPEAERRISAPED